MADKNLLQQKQKMWQDKLAQLEKDYESTMEQRGDAAAMGDLRENAAYQMLTEQGEVISARIGETKKILREIEHELHGVNSKAAH